MYIKHLPCVSLFIKMHVCVYSIKRAQFFGSQLAQIELAITRRTGIRVSIIQNASVLMERRRRPRVELATGNNTG